LKNILEKCVAQMTENIYVQCCFNMGIGTTTFSHGKELPTEKKYSCWD
jgi:hypothetical protein